MDYGAVFYYVLICALGTAFGVVRSARDRDYTGIVHLLCVGLVSGGLAVGCTALVGFYSRGWLEYGAGVAVVVGISGRTVTDAIIVDLGAAMIARLKWLLSRISTNEPRNAEDSEKDDSQ